MPVLDRDGVSISFDVHGSGPAILLTHGYSDTSALWNGQIEALAADHTLITWDLRGHGQSDSPADKDQYSAALAVADMAALLDHVDAPSAIVGGLSLGGYLSLAFHMAHPERVRALLMISTGPGFRNDDARADWNAYANTVADRFAEKGLSYLTDRSDEPTAAAHQDANGLVLAARHMMTQQHSNVIDSLPSIDVPTLVLVGANDKRFLNAADYMANKVPAATKVVIPEAGHTSNIDQPAAFNAALQSFLASNDL